MNFIAYTHTLNRFGLHCRLSGIVSLFLPFILFNSFIQCAEFFFAFFFIFIALYQTMHFLNYTFIVINNKLSFFTSQLRFCLMWMVKVCSRKLVTYSCYTVSFVLYLVSSSKGFAFLFEVFAYRHTHTHSVFIRIKYEWA